MECDLKSVILGLTRSFPCPIGRSLCVQRSHSHAQDCAFHAQNGALHAKRSHFHALGAFHAHRPRQPSHKNTKLGMKKTHMGMTPSSSPFQVCLVCKGIRGVIFQSTYQSRYHFPRNRAFHHLQAPPSPQLHPAVPNWNDSSPLQPMVHAPPVSLIRSPFRFVILSKTTTNFLSWRSGSTPIVKWLAYIRWTSFVER